MQQAAQQRVRHKFSWLQALPSASGWRDMPPPPQQQQQQQQQQQEQQQQQQRRHPPRQRCSS
jgi:uncharacterized membrane protein YccC